MSIGKTDIKELESIVLAIEILSKCKDTKNEFLHVQNTHRLHEAARNLANIIITNGYAVTEDWKLTPKPYKHENLL